MLQEDLEQEQVRVNSLTHMVVVVDESSGDHATAALEEQLKVRFYFIVILKQLNTCFTTFNFQYENVSRKFRM